MPDRNTVVLRLSCEGCQRMFTNMKNLLYLFWMLALVSVGCKSDERDQYLSRPPFASVTDSIRRFPDRADLYLQRALLFSENKMPELATPDYKKAWEIAQEEVTALNYASNLIMINKTDEALALLTDCRKRFPKDSEIARRLGELYASRGRRKEALSVYDDMIRQDSGNFMSWFEKGRLLLKLDDSAAAINAYEKSFALQPLYYNGLELANIYSNQNNPRLLDICDFIISKDSTGEILDARLLKGIYYSNLKNYPEALKYFDECIRLNWKFDQAHIEKGIVFFDKKDYKQALESFKVAATVSNTNPDAYFWMARCFEELKDKEQARENYETALTFDPMMEEAKEGLERIK